MNFQTASKACDAVRGRHAEDAELRLGMRTLARFSESAVEGLRPFAEKYGLRDDDEPGDLRSTLIPASRAGSFGLLRDLHSLYVMSSEVHVALADAPETFPALV